jgi:hypothetical protein
MAGIRHRRLHTWSPRIRCAARGNPRQQEIRLCRKGEERVRAASARRNLSGSQRAPNHQVSVQESAGERALTLGESITAEKMAAMPLGQTEAGMPGR